MLRLRPPRSQNFVRWRRKSLNWCWSVCRATLDSRSSLRHYATGCCRSIGTASASGRSICPAGASNWKSFVGISIFPGGATESGFSAPARVSSRSGRAPEHADRVGSADLSYPLHVVPRHRRWLILDGIHRLVKAEMLGLTDVLVSTLSPADIVKAARHPPLVQAGAIRE